MDLEERLRQTFERVGSRARTDPQAWEGISRRAETRPAQLAARKAATVIAAVGVSIGIFIGLRMAIGTSPESERQSVPGASTAAIYAPHVAATVDVGVYPIAVAAAGDSIWVTVEEDDGKYSLTRVDPQTNEVTASVQLSHAVWTY